MCLECLLIATLLIFLNPSYAYLDSTEPVVSDSRKIIMDDLSHVDIEKRQKILELNILLYEVSISEVTCVP